MGPLQVHKHFDKEPGFIIFFSLCAIFKNIIKGTLMLCEFHVFSGLLTALPEKQSGLLALASFAVPSLLQRGV